MFPRFVFLMLVLASLGAGFVIRQDARRITSRQAYNGDSDDLLQALRNNGLNETAEALSSTDVILQRIYSSPGPKTFLAPTDAAVRAAPSWLDLSTTLLYHFLNGSLPPDNLSRLPSHTILHSFLYDDQYANLPGGNGQAVAMSTNKQGKGQMSEALSQDAFSTAIDAFTVGDIFVQPVSTVMMMPRTSIFTMAQVTNNTLAASLFQYLPFSLDKMRGVTIFAPSDTAINQFRARHPGISDADLLNTFLNHLIANRVVYSPLLTSQASLITMAGQDMRVTTTRSGVLIVALGAATANIVQTDVMHNGGVIHIIDTVLDDAQTDATRASQAARSSLESADSFISGVVTATNSASSQGVSVPPSPPNSPAPTAQNSTVTSVFDATEGGAMTLLPGFVPSAKLPTTSSSTSSARYSNQGTVVRSPPLRVLLLSTIAICRLFL
jgi:archaellum component FlaF (FlaF/FlaG flagellin family)